MKFGLSLILILLLGSIAGSLTSGVGGIAGSLNALMRDITHMIGEVAKKNEEAA